MNSLRPITEAWIIPIPQSDSPPVNFTFNAKIGSVTYPVVMKWYNDLWHSWWTFPDTTIREAGIFSGDVSWSAYDDFGLYIQTSLDTIGQLDLPNITMYFLQWGI